MGDNNTQLKPKWGLFGAIVSAIGASVCCLGPLVLVGLGFSGAWIGNLSVFNRYRPFFMVFTFVFLGFAFYKVYFKSKKERCETVSYCVNPKAERINKIALWSVAILSVGMLVLPGLLGMLSTKDPTSMQVVSTQQAVFNVEGMTCGGCALTIEKGLKNLDGIKMVRVTFEPSEAIVNYNPDFISIKRIMEAIKNLGYSSILKGGD